MKGYVKDPDAVLDYGFDWGPWLGTDTIATSTWIVESPLTIVPASESNDSTTTLVYISGGTAGQDYDLTNRITTNDGRTDDRTIKIKVRSR
jgi:hypothetical protein